MINIEGPGNIGLSITSRIEPYVQGKDGVAYFMGATDVLDGLLGDTDFVMEQRGYRTFVGTSLPADELDVTPRVDAQSSSDCPTIGTNCVPLLRSYDVIPPLGRAGGRVDQPTSRTARLYLQPMSILTPVVIWVWDRRALTGRASSALLRGVLDSVTFGAGTRCPGQSGACAPPGY
jgi:hypothetical protein